MDDTLKLLAEIDKVISLGQKGLARVNEANDVAKKAEDFLKNNLNIDDEFGREFDKWSKVSRWQDMSRDGYANRSHLAPLQPLRDFLTRFLDTSDVKTILAQQYVRTGEVFTGRRAIRDILSQAKSKIDIQDNYLDSEVFAILEPYFENNANLQSRLLTGTRVNNAFQSDLTVFAKQFGRISAKAHDQAHGRFIILDGEDVYSVGHSLKDLGKKADVISKIGSEEALKKAIEDFENWWRAGQEIAK
jgi:hypothetical protein